MAESVRVALVTGAARGIGAATVDALCAEGYRVVAFGACADDQRPDGVRYQLSSTDELREVASRHPGQIEPFVGDVRDPQALREATAVAVTHFGRLDVAVAAAAVVVGGETLWQTPDSHLKTLLDVDVVGVWNTAAASVPHMLAGPDPSGCRFVAIASAAAHTGLFHLAGYSAAKHAVVGITKGLAADLVGTGVTSVAVSPGSTRTSMLTATAALYNLPEPEDLAHHQLLRRLVEAGEVAQVIAFCCSLGGAALNGSVVDASGGFKG